MNFNLILASSSQSRKEILNKLEIPFTCKAPDIDETPKENETPDQLVARLSYEKAFKIFQENPTSVVIGSDQIAILEGEILGKPSCYQNARAQLAKQSGKMILFKTGLCLLSPFGANKQYGFAETKVYFRNLTDKTIEKYLNKEKPYSAAGSLKAEGLGIALLEKIEGEDPNTLIGLPLIMLTTFLKNIGIDLPN